IDRADVQEQMQAARAMADEARAGARVSADIAFGRTTPMPFAFAPQQAVGIAGPAKLRAMGGNEDSLYQRGQSALDSKRWDDAAAYFGEAAAKNGPRGDGALYWK